MISFNSFFLFVFFSSFFSFKVLFLLINSLSFLVVFLLINSLSFLLLIVLFLLINSLSFLSFIVLFLLINSLSFFSWKVSFFSFVLFLLMLSSSFLSFFIEWLRFNSLSFFVDSRILNFNFWLFFIFLLSTEAPLLFLILSVFCKLCCLVDIFVSCLGLILVFSGIISDVVISNLFLLVNIKLFPIWKLFLKIFFFDGEFLPLFTDFLLFSDLYVFEILVLFL